MQKTTFILILSPDVEDNCLPFLNYEKNEIKKIILYSDPTGSENFFEIFMEQKF